MDRNEDQLRQLLRRVSGRGYGAYRDLAGRWSVGGLTLDVLHVQGDPFAAPSRVRVQVPGHRTGLARELCVPGSRAVGAACCLARHFAVAARSMSGKTGSGRSGEVSMVAPAQVVFPQTAVQIAPDGAVEARFTAGLPARGRRILGPEAEALLLERIPALVDVGLRAESVGPDTVAAHADANEDAEALRAQLASRGLVAFVADGSILPRRSGVDTRPLSGPSVVPFASPESLRVTLDTPNGGPVSGMGIPTGVTLIVGGGFHGKSTLLTALQEGVYNHRPGDGRERVVTDSTAVKIRAEDGRSVAGVDISPFIGTLPGGGDTSRFTTANASGSTSQAAAIVEELEAGARVLLVDEDTAATNFMIRDRRMQALVPSEDEPITPFVDRVRPLHRDRGVSTVLVLGGSGDYLDVADHVIALRDFRPRDATSNARNVASRLPTGRTPSPGGLQLEPAVRSPDPGSFSPRRGRRPVSVRVREARILEYGEHRIDLSCVESLVESAQVRALGYALAELHERASRTPSPLAALLDEIEADLTDKGLDVLDRRQPGDLAWFRRFELAAALNRIRGLEVL